MPPRPPGHLWAPRPQGRPAQYKQRQRLTALFADDEHVQVEATWGIYQHMIAAYRVPDRKRGRELMQQLIGSISHCVPTALRGFRNLTNYIARSLLENRRVRAPTTPSIMESRRAVPQLLGRQSRAH